MPLAAACHRYESWLQKARAQLAPRGPADRAPSVLADRTVWSLVLVNGAALSVALMANWQLADLMAVYWVQSVIVGGSYFGRIMALEKFSTKNFRINGHSVQPTAATKRKTAAFFALHFGIFHLGYLVFIASERPAGLHPDVGLGFCAAAFAINHFFSYRYYRELDRSGTPNIGTLMFTPYLRILPMHLTIIFGAAAMESPGVVLFGLLKTLADVAMHWAEHRVLGQATSPR